MGKIKKIRAKSKKPNNIGDNKVEEDTTDARSTVSDARTLKSFSQILPKDIDLESVKSFKSLKNKFGIKKHIKKTDKLKLKKEILKQKIDVLKESKTNKRTKVKQGSKGSSSVENENSTLSMFLSGNMEKKKIIKDPEEESFVKLGNKVKGIQKKDKRKKQMIKDINILKHLMTKAKNKLN